MPVTGASGYLGGKLCRALLNQGHSGRALVCCTSDISGLPFRSINEPFELAYGDATDYLSLLDACASCHIMFHAAALVEPWLPDPSRFCEDSGTFSKQLKRRNQSGKMIESFNGRLPGYIGRGNDKFYFSLVDDVVEGYIAAMGKGRPGETYLLTGEKASFIHVFDMAAVITGTRRLMDGYRFFWLESQESSLLSVNRVRVLRHQWGYSCGKAKTELGYNPRSLKEGLAEVLPWLRSLGVIKY